MTLDDFFIGGKQAWEKEQQRKIDEAKAQEEEERRKRIEKLKSRRKEAVKPEPAATAPPPAIIPAGTFQIESLPDRYRIHDVPYRGSLYVVDWGKELLDKGNKHNQWEWIASTQSTEWKIPDLQLYHATLSTLYHHREHAVQEQKKLVDEMKNLFKTDFDPAQPFMMTSTRINYAAHWLDEVTHNVGYPSAQQHLLTLVGPDALINASSGLEEQMGVLLGSRDLAEIEKVYEWIRGGKPYLRRFYAAPERDTEKMAVLGCVKNIFSISCENSTYHRRLSRGVVVSHEIYEGAS